MRDLIVGQIQIHVEIIGWRVRRHEKRLDFAEWSSSGRTGVLVSTVIGRLNTVARTRRGRAGASASLMRLVQPYRPIEFRVRRPCRVRAATSTKCSPTKPASIWIGTSIPGGDSRPH